MCALDGRQRDALHRRMSGGRREALLEALRQPREVALVEAARATVRARPQGLEPALLVLAAQLPQPLGREAERLGEPAEMTLRVLGELDQDRVSLELSSSSNAPISVPPMNTSVLVPRTTTLPRDENQLVIGSPATLGNLSGSDLTIALEHATPANGLIVLYA